MLISKKAFNENRNQPNAYPNQPNASPIGYVSMLELGMLALGMFAICMSMFFSTFHVCWVPKADTVSGGIWA